ncbi:MAG: helix-turn-helix transcriptional regulator [Bryobacteraceae bacterium]
MSASAAIQAEYLILRADLPGHDPRNIGVFLYDPIESRLEMRLMDDFSRVAADEDADILERLEADLTRKVDEMGADRFLAWLEDTASNTLRVSDRETVAVHDFGQTLSDLYREHVAGAPRAAKVIPFVTHLPLYSLRAAATRFGEDMETECEAWLEAPAGIRITPDMFIARVVGRSMEPLIPDGSLCVFRANVVGSRQGKRLLIQRLGVTDSSAEFTVKQYRSEKVATSEDEWTHRAIRLEPLNPDFDPMVFTAEDESQTFRVIGEFVRVL